MTKQLFIIYDKEYKACAELLYNLLSQHTNIKASMYTQKEIGKLVSREKCLYIGTGCSSNLKFEDLYEELGVHVGYLGAKAWIRCFKYKWNISEFEKLEKILESYSKQYKAKDINEKFKSKFIRNDILEDFVLGLEPWPGNLLKRANDKYLCYRERLHNPITSVPFAYLSVGAWAGVQISKLFGVQPAIRDYQYYVGVFTFYEKYLNVFLEISELDDTDIKQEESLENEKKKKE